ncbi:SIMPL domain-containing protein [Mycobacterium sp. Aquia_213]|uniref:SIMPL domain-containing protein n=1 Tax=Mycobacterium sp. Aquia_213 TaxID=2991728 RepID=UPI00226E56D3|nr:SIMPL domain-containing protein [Mycobacterium sp. Aquia_213]WAC92058.1 SIMPL domain-containing protein [Mycobacterium sp. Aquia_213]
MAIEKRAPGCIRASIAVAAVGLALTTVSACDSHNAAPPGANPRQVTVVGSGQVQGVPDTLTADVGIEFNAPDVTSAMNQTNDRQQAVINALVGAGIDRKDISTTQVTLQPQYGGPEPGGTATITGYRATNAIQVKIHPTDAASRMLALIVSTGGDATRITSVSFSIADDSQLVKDARARAFNDAKNRADQYAQLSGLRLGKVLSISESTGGSVTAGAPQSPPKAMAVPVPLEPGQQTVSFSVTAAWELD